MCWRVCVCRWRSALVTLAGPAVTSQRHLRALEGPLRSMIAASDTTGLELLATELLLIASEAETAALQGRVHELLRGYGHAGVVLAVESRLFGFALWRAERGELELPQSVRSPVPELGLDAFVPAAETPAGPTAAATVHADPEDDDGCGSCATTGGPAGGLLALVGFALLGRRRRR